MKSSPLANALAKADEFSLKCFELTDRLARLCNVSERSLRQPRPDDATINIPDQRRELRFEIEQSRALIAALEGSYPSCTDADLAKASDETRAVAQTRGLKAAPDTESNDVA